MLIMVQLHRVITGTHDVYYAEVPIKGKAIYLLNFTQNNNKLETKNKFIELLNKLNLKSK